MNNSTRFLEVLNFSSKFQNAAKNLHLSTDCDHNLKKQNRLKKEMSVEPERLNLFAISQTEKKNKSEVIRNALITL